MDLENLRSLSDTWIEQLWTPGDPEGSPLGYLLDRGLTAGSIEDYYLGYTGDDGVDGKYAGCISIPYFTGTGQFRGVRFRRLEGTPKYDHIQGERAHLFNVGSVKHQDVFLTEGEFDAIILEQIGVPSVGIPGTNAFKEEWKWLFIGNKVRIVFDADANDAGKKAARKLAHTLRGVAEAVEVVELPLGYDVSSLYVENPARLSEIIEAYE